MSLRLAIEAGSEAEAEAQAQAITSLVLSRMRRELPLPGEPVVTPLPARDGMLRPDPAVLEGIRPDDATNCCRYLGHHFGSCTWMSRDSGREARWDWPPDIWNRQPGTDDVLLHPPCKPS